MENLINSIYVVSDLVIAALHRGCRAEATIPSTFSYNVFPTPFFLHRVSYTVFPTPCLMHHVTCTMPLAPSIMRHVPYTMVIAPCTMVIAPCIILNI